MTRLNVDFRQYLEKQYESAIHDFKFAGCEDEQWQARHRMAELERTAMELYGFEYCDNLHNKYCGYRNNAGGD